MVRGNGSYGYGFSRTPGAMLGALLVLFVLAGPVAAQEGPFKAVFGEGYDFLHKNGDTSISLSDRNVVQAERPFQTLFAESYAVTKAIGGQLVVTKPVTIPPTNAENLPFESLFGDGYGIVSR
jgi:hypothetical protein